MRRRTIEIDCPPGDPRPGDLIGKVIKGTSLPLRDDVGCRFFGWWTWDYSDIAPDVWKRARPMIRRRLVRLYEQGVIRYAHVSLGKGEGGSTHRKAKTVYNTVRRHCREWHEDKR